uniref:Uncharacterized protein n=1 Tax=Alexandrium catenella TaxID=2925 RepID=A0A6T9BCJ4_ALECA
MAKATVLPVLLAGAFCILFLRSALVLNEEQGDAFVNPQLRSTAATLAETEGQRAMLPQAAALAPAVAAALMPELASAATQQELNRFGFVFAVIFLLFFLAAFARLLTVGKL